MKLKWKKYYNPGKMGRRKKFTVKVFVLISALLVAGVVGIFIAFGSSNRTVNNSTPVSSGPHTTTSNFSTETTPAQNTIDADKIFSQYESTYDTDSASYSFNYGDLSSYFSGNNYGSLGYGTSTYRSGNETWTINCSQYSGSCTAYSSNGYSASSYCSQYTNSCSTYGSDGSSANTYCSDYTNSCSTYGSDGYSSNTYCSNYTSSCSSYESDGSYSSTYCSQYTNSCSTYGSDGSYSNTYCSSYSTSCSSYGSSGTSSYYNW